MEIKTRFQADLMIYAIENDWFGYASHCDKLKNGKYKVIVDGIVSRCNLTELSQQWQELDTDTQQEIIDNYVEEKGILCWKTINI